MLFQEIIHNFEDLAKVKLEFAKKKQSLLAKYREGLDKEEKTFFEIKYDKITRSYYFTFDPMYYVLKSLDDGQMTQFICDKLKFEKSYRKDSTAEVSLEFIDRETVSGKTFLICSKSGYCVDATFNFSVLQNSRCDLGYEDFKRSMDRGHGIHLKSSFINRLGSITIDENFKCKLDKYLYINKDDIKIDKIKNKRHKLIISNIIKIVEDVMTSKSGRKHYDFIQKLTSIEKLINEISELCSLLFQAKKRITDKTSDYRLKINELKEVLKNETISCIIT